MRQSNWYVKNTFIRQFKIMNDNLTIDEMLDKFYEEVFEKGYESGYNYGFEDGERFAKENDWENNGRLTW